jgi:glycosyltransferase involved in cell wall biosynthesis
LYLFIAGFYIVIGLFQAVLFCRKERFDLLHVHWPFPHGIWGYVAGKLSHTPMVLTFHGAELLLSRKFGFVKYFIRHSVKHAKAVICNSTYTAREVAQLTGKKAFVIPFGSTVSLKPTVTAETKPVKDLLFVGRLIERKGLEHLIRALPLVEEKLPVHLHVVGDGNMADTWKLLVREMGLDGKITFYGVIPNDQLESLYASADVFVLPAIVDHRGDTEGLGVVLVEALSFGVPVVASAVGGIPDVVIDEKTGLLVPQKDPPALAEAIIRILTDPGLATVLAKGGLAHAQQYFNWDRITSCLIDVYQKVATKTD